MTLLQRTNNEQIDVDESDEGIAERLTAIDKILASAEDDLSKRRKIQRVQTTRTVSPS